MNQTAQWITVALIIIAAIGYVYNRFTKSKSSDKAPIGCNDCELSAHCFKKDVITKNKNSKSRLQNKDCFSSDSNINNASPDYHEN